VEEISFWIGTFLKLLAILPYAGIPWLMNTTVATIPMVPATDKINPPSRHRDERNAAIPQPVRQSPVANSLSIHCCVVVVVSYMSSRALMLSGMPRASSKRPSAANGVRLVSRHRSFKEPLQLRTGVRDTRRQRLRDHLSPHDR
jgi:hypothetical protein